MLLLIVFAFLAGIVTILSPCILPILPIVLSGSIDGDKRRPWGIVTGFIISFTFFTLALTTIVKATGVSPDVLRWLAVVVIFGFGLSLIIPQTQVLLEKIMSRLSGLAPQTQNKTGWWGGLVIGFSLGLLWAPCVGPILASVITLALTSQVTLSAVFITFAYSLGTAIPMLAIMYGGRALLQKAPGLLANTGKIQKGFGLMMMLVAVAILLNWDRQLQTYVLQVFPQYGAGLTAFENNATVTEQLSQLKDGVKKVTAPRATLAQPGLKAPELTGGTQWFNSEPLTLADLRGKVVLIDFWTYSCINCIRTFPYLRTWYSTYKDQGFVIIGVHSPEFEFEKKPQNVEKALADFDLKYPVVQDNDFTIWRNYNNQYWPAHYLIDAQGNVRYTHFGEGNYEETEAAIRQLLSEAGHTLNQEMITDSEAQPNRAQTPETYLGLNRMERVETTPTVKGGVQTFEDPGQLSRHTFGFQGTWNVQPEYSQAESGAELKLQFVASQVFLVLTPTAPGDTVEVYLDNQLVEAQAGQDVKQGKVILDTPRLYHLIDLQGQTGEHTLKLHFNQSGTQAFAFTFG